MRNIDAGVLRFVFSTSIQEEYIEKLSDARVVKLFERHGVSIEEVRDVIDSLCSVGDEQHPRGTAPPFSDEDDRAYLHCVETGGADYLITFDRALLDRGAHGRTIILTPGDLIRELLRSVGPLVVD